MEGVIFTPLSGAFFRAWGELEPALKAPMSFARSFPLPTPSTISGALAYNLFTGKCSSNRENSWIDQFKHVFNNCLISRISKIRGPYLIISGRRYLPLDSGNPFMPHFFPVEDIGEIAKMVWRRGYREAREDIVDASVRPVYRTKPGIALSENRTAREGYLYMESILEGFRFRDTIVTRWSYGVDVDMELPLSHSAIIRFGGEGFAAKVSFGNPSLYDCLPDASGEEWILITMSPMLLREITSGDAKAELVHGSVRMLGVGFDTRKGKRRPIYPAIMPGSLIFLNEKISYKELYKNYTIEKIKIIDKVFLVEDASRLGYGSFYPVMVDG